MWLRWRASDGGTLPQIVLWMVEPSATNSSARYTAAPASLGRVWTTLKGPTRMRKHAAGFMNGHQSPGPTPPPHQPTLERKRTRWVNRVFWRRATRGEIEFPGRWCNPLVRVRARCYYLTLDFMNRRCSGLMTRFPPCPSCMELPADLGRLPRLGM